MKTRNIKYILIAAVMITSVLFSVAMPVNAADTAVGRISWVKTDAIITDTEGKWALEIKSVFDAGDIIKVGNQSYQRPTTAPADALVQAQAIAYALNGVKVSEVVYIVTSELVDGKAYLFFEQYEANVTELKFDDFDFDGIDIWSIRVGSKLITEESPKLKANVKYTMTVEKALAYGEKIEIDNKIYTSLGGLTPAGEAAAIREVFEYFSLENYNVSGSGTSVIFEQKEESTGGDLKGVSVKPTTYKAGIKFNDSLFENFDIIDDTASTPSYELVRQLDDEEDRFVLDFDGDDFSSPDEDDTTNIKDTKIGDVSSSKTDVATIERTDNLKVKITPERAGKTTIKINFEATTSDEAELPRKATLTFELVITDNLVIDASKWEDTRVEGGVISLPVGRGFDIPVDIERLDPDNTKYTENTDYIIKAVSADDTKAKVAVSAGKVRVTGVAATEEEAVEVTITVYGKDTVFETNGDVKTPSKIFPEPATETIYVTVVPAQEKEPVENNDYAFRFTENLEGKSITVDFDKETLDVLSEFDGNYEIVAYSLNGGTKWTKIKTPLSGDSNDISAILSKAASKLMFTTELDSKSSLTENSLVWILGEIVKRPSAPKFTPNYGKYADNTATTNGNWTLNVNGAKTYNEAALDKLGLLACVQPANGKTLSEGEQWEDFDVDEGIPVAGLNYDGKVVSETYLFRQRAQISESYATDDNAKITPPSKIKKLKVSGLQKHPTVKPDYKKESVKFKAGLSYKFGEDGIYTTALAKGSAPVKNGVKLPDSATTLKVFVPATDKKPASAVREINIAGKPSLGADDAITIIKGKAKLSKGYEVYNKSNNKYGGLPKITSNANVAVRTKNTAKVGKDGNVISGERSSLDKQFSILWGALQEDSRGNVKQGVIDIINE